jgi:hypothetical protein
MTNACPSNVLPRLIFVGLSIHRFRSEEKCVMRHFIILALCLLLSGILSSNDALAQAAPQPASAASEVRVIMDKDAALDGIQARRVDGSTSQVSVPLDQVLRMQGRASDPDRRSLIRWLIFSSFGFVGVSLVIIIVVALWVRGAFWRYAAQLGPAKWRNYLMQLPLGAPEGSVRALLSLFVVVFGLVVISLQSYLQLGNVEAIAGFVGMVITFYFTSRAGEQTRKSAQQAQEALSNTVSQTAQALQTATDKAADSQRALAQQVLDQSSKVASTALQTVRTAAQAGDAPIKDSVAAGGPGADLATLHGKLTAIQQVAKSVSDLGVGPDVLPNVTQTIASVTDLIGRIEPLLSGKPDAAAVANALQTAAAHLPALQASGLPGAIAEATEVLGGAAGPIIAGLPFGPIGIAGGVLISAIQLAGNAPKLSALKAALLGTPFDPVLMPEVADKTVAPALLQMSPLMSAHFQNASDDDAFKLMTLAVAKKPDSGARYNAADLAELCAPEIKDGSVHYLPHRSAEFMSQDELMQAFDDYLGALVRMGAASQLTDTVTVPVPASTTGDPSAPSTVNLKALADAVFKQVADPKAAAQVERLLYLGEALGKLPIDKTKAIGLVAEALGAVARGGLVLNRETSNVATS